jgi:hypothetical protein
MLIMLGICGYALLVVGRHGAVLERQHDVLTGPELCARFLMVVLGQQAQGLPPPADSAGGSQPLRPLRRGIALNRARRVLTTRGDDVNGPPV